MGCKNQINRPSCKVENGRITAKSYQRVFPCGSGNPIPVRYNPKKYYLGCMLYHFGKVVMWITLHFYFRRIIFVGKDTIPDDEAVILISNHSASFLDAMLMGVLMKRPVSFYARSDIFRKPLVNRILRKFHMIPIYNIEHGKANLVRNEETFAEGERILNDKGMLLIFPEGTSRVERIMLPLKKGTARVAIQTESKKDFTLGIRVIPVGINYSRHRFRADVLLQTGEPTRIDRYADAYRENPAKAITQLTRELEEKFAGTILFVKQADRTMLIDRLLELYRNDVFRPADHLRGVPILAMEKKVCAGVSELGDDASRELSGNLDRYDGLLLRHGLADASVNGRYHFALLHLLGLVVFSPVFVIGFMLNFIPLRFGKWVADKTVTRIDFYTSVNTAAGGFGYLLWWLLLIIAAMFIGNAWVWLAVVTAPLTLFAGMRWWEAFRAFIYHVRYLWAKRTNKELVLELSALRSRVSIWKQAGMPR